MMTREEEILSYLEDINPKEIASHIERGTLDQWTKAWKAAAAGTVISALRTVSRERVEKVWGGEWQKDIPMGYKCNSCEGLIVGQTPFCPVCGKAMTDEAVEMVMERMEKIK